MAETIQTTDMRRRVREVLDRMCVQRQPVVVIIPCDEFEDYRAWRDRQQQR
jgi:hypothetical protein